MTTREARIRGRANMPAEQRSAISRRGGLARLAKHGAESMREMAANGGRIAMLGRTPDERRAFASSGARATNAKLGTERKREIGRQAMAKRWGA